MNPKQKALVAKKMKPTLYVSKPTLEVTKRPKVNRRNLA